MVPCFQKLSRRCTLSALKCYSSEIARSISSDCIEIPSPRKWGGLHTLSVMVKSRFGKKLHEYIDNTHLRYGPVFRDTLGPVTAVFVSDPNEMRRVFAHEGKYPKHILPEAWLLYNEKFNYKRGLYFMDGEEWLLYRKLLNSPLLRDYDSQKLLTWCQPVVFRAVDEMYATSKDGEVRNLELQLYRLSINFMLTLMIGSSAPDHLYWFESETQHLAHSVRNIFKESVALSQIPAKLAAEYNLPRWKRFVDAVSESIEMASVILTRMAPIISSDGLVYQLLQSNVPKEKISSIIVDFILAAGDTTAVTTQWALYLLSIHPDSQEAVAEEFKNTSLQENCESELMRGILRETLRLFPVAPFLGRSLPTDVKLFDTYLVPANEMIILSVYSSSHSEKYFPKAEEFIPARWSRSGENSELLGVNDPFGTLPYAMGARSCIGRKIAQSQICFTLAAICKYFDVQPMDTVEMNLHLIPVPNKPVRLHFEPRHR